MTDSPTGSLLRLGGRLRLDGLWLGPAVAALAGALVSDYLRWNASLLLLLLLADLGWGNLWWALAGTDWYRLREGWNAWGTEGCAAFRPALPYLQPSSPAGRLMRWWTDLRAWGRTRLWPERGAQLGALLLGLPVALVLSAALGIEMVLMTMAVLAISQLALFLGPADGRASSLAQATVEVGIPWLSGSLLFGRLDGTVLSAAVGLVLAYMGLSLLARDRRGGFLLLLGQLILVLVLLTLDQVLAATVVGVLLLPQFALLPWHNAGLDGPTMARLAQWSLLISIFVVALAI